MRQINISKLLFIFFLFLGIQPLAGAAFDVNCAEEEDNCFGNAQSEVFKRAMDGDGILCAGDRAFLSCVDSTRMCGWRLKALVGRPRISIDDVTVISTTPDIVAVGPGFGLDTFQLILGAGYKWRRWALDLEVLGGEQIHPVVAPSDLNPAVAFLSQFNPTFRYFALFLNLEYEIPRFLDFIPSMLHPYIQGGGGMAVKSTNSTLSIGGVETLFLSHDVTTYAWNAGVGIRFEITGQLLGDISYRWVDFGGLNSGTQFGAPLDPFVSLSLSSPHVRSRGLYFGITYML
jgi:hypothetical protein